MLSYRKQTTIYNIIMYCGRIYIYSILITSTTYLSILSLLVARESFHMLMHVIWYMQLYKMSLYEIQHVRSLLAQQNFLVCIQFHID